MTAATDGCSRDSGKMRMSEFYLTDEEKLVFSLRSLWKKSGYSFIRVSSAEEYDFYVRNKEFLPGRGVITFTDADGTLMALKSDVTLSLVKKLKDDERGVQRLMYNEKIYRIPRFSSSFREIEQTGLECLGDLTEKEIAEAVLLGEKSLSLIGGRTFLAVSHMGIINHILEGVGAEDRETLISLVEKRKTEDILRLSKTVESLEKPCSLFLGLLDPGKTNEETIAFLSSNGFPSGAVSELEAVVREVGNVVFDFSSLGAFGYYNGIIFKGYAEGLSRPVLQGGEYSLLLRRMNRRMKRGVGFAVYMDEMEEKER